MIHWREELREVEQELVEARTVERRRLAFACSLGVPEERACPWWNTPVLRSLYLRAHELRFLIADRLFFARLYHLKYEGVDASKDRYLARLSCRIDRCLEIIGH